MLTFDKVVDAYYSCRVNKRNTFSSLNFEVDLFENLTSLYEDLKSGKYYPSPSICFVVSDPKYREVWASQFRDRVVHHLIFKELNSWWGRRWSADSCATIKGRGTLYGVDRLESSIRSYTNNWSEDKWYLKCDLSNYFNSIDKDILWRVIEPSIEKDWVKRITKTIVYNNPVENGIFLSSEEEFNKVPKRKRLSYTKHNRGLPIGDLLSQMFSNILLNGLDQYVKRVLKVNHYVRYVDDYIILGDSSESLSNVLRQINDFLLSLGLENNPKKCFIHKISRGVSFLGQTIHPHRRVILTDTFERFEDKVDRDNLDCYISLLHQAKNSYYLSESLISGVGAPTKVRKHLDIKRKLGEIK